MTASEYDEHRSTEHDDRRTPSEDEPLLEVRDLVKHFPITAGVLKRTVGNVRAVDGISFDIHRGETFGLVGESGCGKSTAARSILHLERPTAGTVRFRGEDVTAYGPAERKRFRRHAQMIFQDPDSSFDPRMTVGDSVGEPLLVNGMRDKRRRRDLVENMLVRVGLEPSDADRYPHELSGGQKQRIALARALVVNPDLLVADEPVSALDVSIQADILAMMDELQRELGLAVLIISHNLGVVRSICDRVAVMYLGEIVETGPTEAVFSDPQHPYTQALTASIPTPDPTARRDEIRLTGDVPSPARPPPGCRFHTRCPVVIQPEGYAFEQAHWRSVMDLKQHVHAGQFDADTVREAILAERQDVEEPDSIEYEAFDQRLRAEYDIPSPLADRRAEAILAEVVDALFAGDLEVADDRLAEAFESVCRRERPNRIDVSSERERGADRVLGGEHVAACHLIDPDGADTPQATASDQSSVD